MARQASQKQGLCARMVAMGQRHNVEQQRQDNQRRDKGTTDRQGGDPSGENDPSRCELSQADPLCPEQYTRWVDGGETARAALIY